MDTNQITNMGFSVNAKTVVDEFIHLDIFGGEWIEIARILIQTKTENQVVGEFWDDYGATHHIASDGNGGTINVYFENEESDEMFQDGFDEEAYYLEYEKNKSRWKSMIPKSVESIFS